MNFRRALDHWLDVFVFILVLVGTLSAINYFDSSEVFDANLIYVNNMKAPYSVLVSVETKIDETLDYEIEIIYKKDNLVVSSDNFKCSDVCERKLVLKKFFFDTYDVIIRSKYDGRFFEKKLQFDLEKPPASFDVKLPSTIIYDSKSTLDIKGTINSYGPRTYVFDIFPTRKPEYKEQFKLDCDSEVCDFDFGLNKQIIFGEYTMNIYSDIDNLQRKFKVDLVEEVNMNAYYANNDNKILYNSEGKLVDAKIKISNSNKKPGKKDLVFEFANSSKVKNIRVNGANPNDVKIGFEKVPKEKVKTLHTVTNAFAIDPHLPADVDSYEITYVATGIALYKCKDYNFTTQNCFGTYEKVIDTVPGQEYNLSFTPEDPQFIDVNDILLAPYSALCQDTSGTWASGICDDSGYSGDINCPASGGGSTGEYTYCDDNVVESQTIDKDISGGIGGVDVGFNTTIATPCENITKVEVLYETWVPSANKHSTQIEVDADGDGFIAVVTGIVTTTANPGVSSFDVTNSLTGGEQWDCDDFFSSGATARIRNYATSNDKNPADVVTDVLYYRVSYNYTLNDGVVLDNDHYEEGETVYFTGVDIWTVGSNVSINITRNDTTVDSIGPFTVNSTGQFNGTYSIGASYGVGDYTLFAIQDDDSSKNFTMTFPVVDFPTAVTNLTSIVDGGWIYWSWNQTTANHYESIIYIDGVAYSNSTNNYLNYSINCEAPHTITVHCLDIYGNLNTTDINNTNQSTISYLEGSYPPTAFSFNGAGGLNSGSFCDVGIKDTVDHVYDEINGFDTYYNFTGMTTRALEINYSGNYDGTNGHTVEGYLWNYTSGSWVDIDSVLEEFQNTGTTQVDNIFNISKNALGDVFSGTPGNYEARIRIWHIQTITTAHFMNIDQMIFMDPPPIIDFISPTPQSGPYTKDWAYINVTVEEATIDTVTLEWAGVNETISCTGTVPTYICGANKTGLTDGVYNFKVHANATDGEYDNSSLRYISIDSTGPIVNLTSPSNSYITGVALNNFIGNFSDNINLKNATLMVWNGSNDLIYSNSIDISGTTNGTSMPYTLPAQATYYWNYYVYDEAGFLAYNATNYTLVYLIGGDVIDPIVNLSSPENGSLIGGNWNNFTGIFSDETALKNATLQIWNDVGSLIGTNSTTITGLSDSATLYFNFTSEGFFYWNYLIYDLAGNNAINATNYTVEVDFTKPKVNLTSPENNSANSIGTYQFKGNFSDTRNLKNATLLIYNSSGSLMGINSTIFSGLFASISLNYTFAIEDTYYWNYLVYDEANNSNVSSYNLTFSIDTTPPFINFTSPTDDNDTWVNRSWTYINVTIDDNSLNDTWLEWDNTINHTMSCNSITATRDVCYFNKTLIKNGNYTYKVCANDLVGQQNCTQIRYLSINKTLPLITINSPILNKTYLESSTIYFNMTTLVEANASWYVLSPGGFSDNLSNTTLLDWNASNNNINKNKEYNVTFYAQDEAGNQVNKTLRFIVVVGKWVSFVKNIESQNPIVYKITYNITNLGSWKNYTLYDIIESNFTYYNFSLDYNNSNPISGNHEGDLLYWNLTLSPYSNQIITYNINSTQDFELSHNYVCSID